MQAEDRGDRVVYRYLPDGERETRALTFAQLDRDARAIAARLQDACARGDRALVLAADGIEFIRGFMACQHAGVVAVPVYPPFPIHAERRVATLRGIARDCGARAVLTGGPMELRGPVVGVAPELGELAWIDVDRVAPEEADGFRPVRVAPADVAFLQYTSGSTSLPKGAVVTHDALMHNEELMVRSFDMGADDVVVGWLPLFHDMGLIGHVIGTLYAGSEAILMPPLAFIQRPARWLRAITRYGGVGSGGPDFAYDLCVRRIPLDERGDIDLSTWRVAINGAEPIRAETLAAFTEAFAPHGFDERAWFPCYGMAECTLLATSPEAGRGARRITVGATALREGRLEPGEDHELVGSGSPRLHRGLAIVDPQTGLPCGAGEIGEIWLSGPDVASGYWGGGERSEAAFGARFADTHEGPFLRTGDLGALYDGELYVTGRLKDLIIIGGRNHYPQDIEATVESVHDALERGACAAFSIDRDGHERLVVLAGVRARHARGADLDALRRSIRAAVAREHGVQADDVVIVAPHSVPKTSSNKIQRAACREAYERGEWAGGSPAPPLEAVR